MQIFTYLIFGLKSITELVFYFSYSGISTQQNLEWENFKTSKFHKFLVNFFLNKFIKSDEIRKDDSKEKYTQNY